MPKYTIEDITKGLECWLNPDSDIWCENCAFCNESEGGAVQIVGVERSEESNREELTK
jgi:hypothetical protein